MAQRNSYCLVYHSQKNAEVGLLALPDPEAALGKESLPITGGCRRLKAAFQAFRVVEDKALADMLADAMRARHDERVQEIGKRIKRFKEGNR